MKITATEIQFNNGDVLKGIVGSVADDYIIEEGSNTNGSYTKWYSGKLECRKVITYTGTVSVSSGGTFINSGSTALQVGDYPQEFIEAPNESLQSYCAGGFPSWCQGHIPPSATVGGSFFLTAGVSRTSSTYTIYAKATGRWKA